MAKQEIKIKVWPKTLKMAQEYCDLRNQLCKLENKIADWTIEDAVNVLLMGVLEEGNARTSHLKECIAELQQNINNDLTAEPGH